MSDSLEKTFSELAAAVAAAPMDSAEDIDAFRIRYLSKKQGQITELLKGITAVEPASRREYGQLVNGIKKAVEERIQTAQEAVSRSAVAAPTGIDLTLPGRRRQLGSLHPITQTEREIRRVFESFGFAVAEGPEVEDDWHNFGALNFPPDHPARDMQDTFWIDAPNEKGEGVLLRTHTSPVQIRVLQGQAPPVRVIAPGRVYRNEAISYKSYCLFHQVEGLYVDEGVSMADLKQILLAFAQKMFGSDVRTRYRPSFFPFTEPSAELDIWWPDDSHPDGGRWMEILGSGMVDPEVLKAVDIDPERYTGYAFGMGVERIAMLRHNINDIRVLYENDVRFLEQFN
ncbi:MAG: phenylalanyl-tRNA synthetase alpha chain [Rhodothermales bacterium]|jgi:phenylalanyl-tRNA synthetase alpha chain